MHVCNTNSESVIKFNTNNNNTCNFALELRKQVGPSLVNHGGRCHLSVFFRCDLDVNKL